MLNTVEYGTGGTPLIIAHGLFGSARNWGVIAKRLSKDRRVICVDMRNHGHSFWSDDHSYAAMATDLAEVIASIGTVDLLGHSMGGKAAMLAALQGAAVRKLIIGDIAPVAYGHTQRHLIDAMSALDLSQIETRQDADTALSRHVAEAGIRAFLLQSLDVREKTWRLNLAVLDRFMDHIIGFPDVTGQFDGPALFLSGSQSDYVLTEHRPLIKTLFPNAKFAKLRDAGHWLHADAPRAFEQTVRGFLDMD